MTYIGLATRFDSSEHNTTLYQQIKQYMTDHNLNVIRIGSSAPDVLLGTSDTFPWNNGDAIDWFLRNTPHTVVIDRHHTINAGVSVTVDWAALNANLRAIADRWTYTEFGNRATVEALNEYGAADFYARMQTVLTTFRNASPNYKHPLIFNRMGYSASNPEPDASWGYTWKTLIDTLNSTYQNGHYYMGHPGDPGTNIGVLYASDIGTRCFNAVNRGHSIINQPMFGTENGADWEEVFSKAEVDQLNIYLQKCALFGYSNVVWFNHGLKNKAQYDSLGLVFPSVAPPPPPAKVKLIFNRWQDGDTNPVKTITVP